MSKIVLPPLPRWAYRTAETEAGLRARDLEVARVVLGAAALKCEGERRLGLDDERAYYGDLMAAAIRALKVSHE